MHTLIEIQYQQQRIIGRICTSLPYLVEVKIIYPYNDFCAKQFSENEDWNSEQQYKIAQQLLTDLFEVCSLIFSMSENQKADFFKLLETLDNFNNKNPVDYQRNRDELMKVFVKTNFTNIPETKRSSYAEMIFDFLAIHLLRNGKESLAKPKEETTIPPPLFSSLKVLLKEYLSKDAKEKLGLLVQQIETQKTHQYSWFLEQEFKEKQSNA